MKNTINRLILLVFQSPGGYRDTLIEIGKDEILIGRPDPINLPGYSPDLDFSFDHYVSREHARIFFQDGKWYIENLKGKHGTFLNQNIVECPMEFEFGTEINTGKTSWTLIPPEWFYFHWENLVVYGHVKPVINCALCHCGIPVLDSITIRKIDERDTPSLKLEFQIEKYSSPWSISIPPLNPKLPNIPFNIEILKRQYEPVRTILSISANGVRIPESESEITILGFWDWLHEPSARKTIAAFIYPHDPIIERIVIGSQDILKELSGFETYDSLLKSGRDDTEQLVMKAIYQFLKNNCRISYESPRTRVFTVQDHPKTSQIIKSPELFFRSDETLEGKATCLDLALLMAACLENIGLLPLVIFTGPSPEKPEHAFIGCWAAREPGFKPVINNDEILSNPILIVECTGITQEPDKKLEYEKATMKADEILFNAQWACAVNVSALRRPPHSITPMQSPYQPEVSKAIELAYHLARKNKFRKVETTHLLYGILSAGGGVIKWLSGKAGFDREKICSELSGIRAKDKQDGYFLGKSQNFRDCENESIVRAHQSGVAAVREQDLIYALLYIGKKSDAFISICGELGIKPDDLMEILVREYYPRTKPLDLPSDAYMKPR